MISLTSISNNMFKIVALAYTNGITLKFNHKARVFILTIEPTDEEYDHYSYNRKKRPIAMKPAIKMTIKGCPECRCVVLGDICINKQCVVNQKPDPKA